MTAASPTTTAPSASSTPSTVRRFLRPASATVRSDGCRIASRRSSASAVAIPREKLVRPRVPDAHPRAEHITRLAPRRQCEGLWPLPGEAFPLTEDGQLPLGPGSRSPCFTRVHTAFAGTLTFTYGCFARAGAVTEHEQLGRARPRSSSSRSPSSSRSRSSFRSRIRTRRDRGRLREASQPERATSAPPPGRAAIAVPVSLTTHPSAVSSRGAERIGHRTSEPRLRRFERGPARVAVAFGGGGAPRRPRSAE